jgi:hypothetical protein
LRDRAAALNRRFGYSHRLIVVLVVSTVIGLKLWFNSGMGDIFLLMVANVGVAVFLSMYFAIRSIIEKEGGRWVSWVYFLLLGGAATWTLLNM